MDDRLTVDTQSDVPRGLCTIKLSGPLLVSNIQAFKNQLRDLETPKLVIDLSAVPHVDSVGIGVLVNALMSRKKHGGSLVLSGVGDRVMAVLKGTQVDQLFRFAASAEEAQAMVAGAG
jgi:anti-sigma B factor antagonist